MPVASFRPCWRAPRRRRPQVRPGGRSSRWRTVCGSSSRPFGLSRHRLTFNQQGCSRVCELVREPLHGQGRWVRVLNARCLYQGLRTATKTTHPAKKCTSTRSGRHAAHSGLRYTPSVRSAEPAARLGGADESPGNPYPSAMKPSSSTSAAHVRKPSPPPEMVAGFSYSDSDSASACEQRYAALRSDSTNSAAELFVSVLRAAMAGRCLARGRTLPSSHL